MNIYLDIDGTILQSDEPFSARLADGAVELLTYIVENCNAYWLTTHCKGDAETAVSYLSDYCPSELLPILRRIKPTDWRTLKTEAIDLQSPFLWLDDYPLISELAYLEGHSRAGRQVLVDLKRPGELERVLNRIKNLVEGEPGPLADIPRQKIVFFTDTDLYKGGDPNRAIDLIAKLEKNHDVTVVTQDMDDLHERVGSTRVIHLNKESDAAKSAIRDADIFVIIGMSSAVAFVHYAGKYALKYIIDPNHNGIDGFTLIRESATIGMERLIEMIQSEFDLT